MSFYNIYNELISQEGILEDLINYYQTLHDENKTRVTDFNEGSEVRTLLEVLSHLGYNLLEETNNTLKNHFISTAEGEYLDLIGANPNVNLPREQGSTATGLVKFTLTNPAIEDITIPAGAIVSNDSVTYETDVDGIISLGETSTYIQVTCTIDGVDGNTKANTIINVNDLNGDYSVSVTNEDDFTNGADFEEDDEYRARLLEVIRADNFGSRGYYENILLSIDNVHDIKVDSNPSATVDYVLNTNRGESVDEAAVTDALALLSDSENIVLGHTYSISSADIVPVEVTVTVNDDCGILETDLIDIVKTYFIGGECTNYPYTFNGFNMGVTADTDSIADALLNLNESITSLTISLDDDSTLTTFEAYYISSVEVEYV
jgi:hypothetical protein